MNLHEFISTHRKDAIKFLCVETVTFVRIEFTTCTNITSVVDDIASFLATLSSRDLFELNIDGGAEPIVISGVINVQQLIGEIADYDDLTLELSIRKKCINGVISIYSLESFVEYVRNSDIVDLLSTISGNIGKNLHFQLFDSPLTFGSSSITFSPNSISLATESLHRDDCILAYQESCSSGAIASLKLMPSDLFLVNRSGISQLDDHFDYLAAILSIAFIANFSSITAGTFSYKIFGYKSLSNPIVDKSWLVHHSAMLVRIFRWIYETKNVSDKVGLVRNVFSIHLDKNGVPLIDISLWDAIQSNYQIYLRGNIESYLEIKGKISELMLESVEKTSRITEDLLDSLKNNVLVVLTFMLTVVLVNGVKDLNVTTIFSMPYLYVVVALCATSSIWLVMLRRDLRNRYNALASAVSIVLTSNYGSVLLQSEIDQAINPTLSRNQDYLVKQISTYTRWWIVLLAIFFLTFAIGFALFGRVESVKSQESVSKTEQKQQTLHSPRFEIGPIE